MKKLMIFILSVLMINFSINASVTQLPNGSYRESCENFKIKEKEGMCTLSCECKTQWSSIKGESWKATSISYPCNSSDTITLLNSDGNLKEELSYNQ